MRKAPAFEHLRADLLAEGGVLRVVLDRPKGNVLTRAMMGELDLALAAHRDDPRLRLVLLRGAGGHFSFGASVEEHRRDAAPGMLAAFHGLVRRVAAYPVPVAALVEGSCLGGAFELVLAAHLCLAAPDARFGCPEIKLGVFPPVLAAIGSARLGGALAERLLLTGALVDAETAARAGLVTALLAPGADPEAQALEWYTRNLEPLSAFALRQGVRVFRQASGLLDALAGPLERAELQYLQEVLPSHDGNEGVEAFLARRPPAWEHR
jgi:cyclohexa-1,5-dienecarbonyl-CoA hydratase